MTYTRKLQQCPYRTGDGKCTHKGRVPLKTKRKCFCGYSKPKQCPLYIEWYVIAKSCERASNGELDYTEDEDDN